MHFVSRAQRAGAPWTAALVLALATGSARAETVHLVRQGDTLSEIALRYGVSEQALRDANHLSDEGLVRLGRKLVIPGDSSRGGGPPSDAPRAVHKPGMLHLVRGTETLNIVVIDKKKR